MHTFTHPDGMTGKVLCNLVTGGNLAWVGSGASVFTLVAIAIERYHAVVHPLRAKYKLAICKLKVYLKLLCLWTKFNISHPRLQLRALILARCLKPLMKYEA